MNTLSFLSNYSILSIIAFLMIKNFTVPQGYQSINSHCTIFYMEKLKEIGLNVD